MKELISRLREKKLPKKAIIMIACAVVVLAGLTISEFAAEEPKTNTEASVCADDYIKSTQKNLERLLSDIEGAGDVRVMLTVDTCYENVYAKSYDTKGEKSENGSENELSEEYIIVKKGSNNEECLVVKVYEPTVKGVAVIAEGADSITVKTAITETVCALFNISTAQVSVEKMCKE
ncbi:MAG: hypothetical protein IKT55_01080 [Clostridia bacterium]|nr:hypothetical protein [Clostridia bacterium]